MEIRSLTLKVKDIHEVRNFYIELLEMELIREEAHSITVQCGKSEITFEQGEEAGFYHFACEVTEAHYQKVVHAIREKNISLRDEEGNDEFDSYEWQTKQFYFEDIEGNNVELLAIPNTLTDKWGGIKEIGLPTMSVEKTTNRLRKNFQDEFQGTGDTFRFFGNRQGVFVVVKVGRPWFPTEKAAVMSSIKITGHDGDREFSVERMEKEEIVC